MKLILIFTVLFFFIPVTFGQSYEVILKLDNNIFNKRNGNIYQSDSTGAKVVGFVLPSSYEQSLPGMQEESNKDAIIISKGVLSGTNRRIYFKKGKVKSGNFFYIIETYAVEYTKEQVIMIISNYKEEYESLIGNQIEMAARMVKIR